MSEYPQTRPCPTCPWRKSSTVGGADIPRFSIEMMRELADTVREHDDFRRIMACHYSDTTDEYPCVGYLIREGWTNLNVRFLTAIGRIPMRDILVNSEYLDLWPNFHVMLEAYEQAQTEA